MKNITVKDISFSYQTSDNPILDKVNLEAEEGDFVCLLGQSGCGKSTFLRLLAGLETPTSGQIEIGGKPIEGPSLDRSMVFQDYGLFPWMTNGANIMLALQQKFPEKKKADWRLRAQEALREVGLADDVFDKYPRELSGGMQQRCAIARSFSIDPPILLMDEPFGALDAVTRARLQDIVIKLWSHQEPKKTVFFVTHDVEEALLLATRIIVFGQKPSHVIFTQKIPLAAKTNRENLYANPDTVALRSELIDFINRDVAERIDETGGAG